MVLFPEQWYNRKQKHKELSRLLKDRYPWRYELYLVPYFLSSSVFMSFISVYFKGLNLSTFQIAVLMASMPAVSIFTQPLLGALGDRTRSKTRLLRVLALGATGCVLLFLVSGQFWWLLLMTLLFAGFYTSQQPLGDSVILEALQEKRRPFGPLRVMACAAFAVSSALVGRIVDGHMERVIYLTAGALLLMFFGSFALPDVKGHQRTKEKLGFRSLLQDEDLGRLLIFIALLQTTLGYFYSFYSVHFLTLPGSTSELLGISYLISALSELPFLLVSDRLFERLGAGKLLVIAALALALRWLSLAVFTDVRLVMTTQLLHGWGFVVILVSMAKYVSLTVPEALRARGQMLLSVVGFGMARVTGTLGGGLLAGKIGYQNGFWVCCAVAAIALLVFAPGYLRRAPLNGE